MDEYEITVVFESGTKITTKFLCEDDKLTEQKVLCGLHAVLALVDSEELNFNTIKDCKIKF